MKSIDDLSLLKCILENHESAVFAIDLNYRYLIYNTKHSNTVRAKFGKEIKAGINAVKVLPSVTEQQSLQEIFDLVFEGESLLLNYKSPESGLVFEYYYYPLREKGEVHGAVLFMNDITEKSKIEASRFLFQSRQIAISHTIPDFFVISSSDGIRKHVNKSYCDFFGIDSKQVIGQSYFLSIPEEDRKQYLASLNKITPESPTISNIHFLRNDRGEEQWTLWNETGIFDQAGNFVEIVSIGRNINNIVEARKVREEYIRVLEKAIFKTSHEIRQPIVNIIGIADLINSNKLNHTEIKETVQFIKQSAKKLDDFTHEMNQFIHRSIENQKNTKQVIQGLKFNNDEFVPQENISW